MIGLLEIHVDGACRGNPGPAGIGVVIRQNGEIIREVSRSIGNATNNIAEYSSLICALEEALKLKAKSLKIYTDSELVCNQVTGKYKVKSESLAKLFNKVNELARDFENIEIKHVPREQNKDADKLASGSLDNESPQSKLRGIHPIKQAKVVASLFKYSEEESPSSEG